MPFYHTLGKIPHKRHTQFCKPDGALYREQVIGTKGFSGIESILYHIRQPTQVKQVETLGSARIEYLEYGPLRHRLFQTRDVPQAGDAVSGRQVLVGNQNVTMAIARPVESMNYHYRNGEAHEILDEAERRIFEVTSDKIRGAAAPLKELVARAYELIEKREGKHVTGLPTGYFELDELTCGLQNGEMIIIAGRPSMGKTSLALNIAEHLGVIEKIPVAIFSLEMGRQQLAERFLCSKGQIDSQLVRKGMLTTEHYQKLVETCGVLSEAPIFVDDTSVLSPLEIRGKARRLASQHNIRCVIVDYLQLMGMGTKKVESRQQEITEISRYMKALARELNIPVVVLSQLNRASEGREDHRPRMSDLRESGSIEQDADVVMLLHREDYYHKGEDGYQGDNAAEVIIAKQRNGPTGSVKLVFREQITRFENSSFAEEPF